MAARDPWVAVDAATDTVEYARLLGRTHAARLSGSEGPLALRPLIDASWQRAFAAGVDPEHQHAPVVYAADDVPAVRDDHPLAAVMPALRHMLGGLVASDARHVLVVGDEQANVLWMEGHPQVRLRAGDIGFVEGVRWSECTAGTNAVGTALALDHPVQVFSAEHLVRAQHTWTCSCAPIHDPETGAPVGFVDVSGPIATAHPYSLALVTAAAEMAEDALRRRMYERHERLRERFLAAFHDEDSALVSDGGRVLMARPAGWVGGRLEVPADGGGVRLPDGGEGVAEPLHETGGVVVRRVGRRTPGNGRRHDPSPRPRLALTLLGGPRPVAVLDDDELPLSERHAEILALLVMHPEGLTSEQLALHLYGEPGNPISARAEVSRLRRLLGRALRARPYRLAATVEADFVEVERLLRAGRPEDALARYRGPLLPRADAPGIVEAREELDAALRASAMDATGPEPLLAWTASASGRDDLPAHEALLGRLGAADARRAPVRAHATLLRRRYGVTPGPPRRAPAAAG